LPGLKIGFNRWSNTFASVAFRQWTATEAAKPNQTYLRLVCFFRTDRDQLGNAVLDLDDHLLCSSNPITTLATLAPSTSSA
jgi:hypothetical protein